MRTGIKNSDLKKPLCLLVFSIAKATRRENKLLTSVNVVKQTTIRGWLEC